MARHKSLIQGVGINDANYFVASIVNGKQVMCPYYQVWKVMLQRCYDKTFQVRQPTYVGTIVCEEWLRFSNFKAWMELQDWEGNVLDKDIIMPNNNIYSPDTCIFIKASLNNLFCTNKAIRGLYPVGVHLDKISNKFIAQITRFNIGAYLGSYLTAKEASLAYINAKVYYIGVIIGNLQEEYPKSHLSIKDGLLRHIKILEGSR